MPTKLSVTGMVVGGLFTLGPLFGLLGTAYGMYRSFNTLGNAGISDPRELSQGVNLALVSTATGMVLCPIGIVVLTLSIIFYIQARKSVPPPLPPAFDSVTH